MNYTALDRIYDVVSKDIDVTSQYPLTDDANKVYVKSIIGYFMNAVVARLHLDKFPDFIKSHVISGPHEYLNEDENMGYGYITETAIKDFMNDLNELPTWDFYIRIGDGNTKYIQVSKTGVTNALTLAQNIQSAINSVCVLGETEYFKYKNVVVEWDYSPTDNYYYYNAYTDDYSAGLKTYSFLRIQANSYDKNDIIQLCEYNVSYPFLQICKLDDAQANTVSGSKIDKELESATAMLCIKYFKNRFSRSSETTGKFSYSTKTIEEIVDGEIKSLYSRRKLII